MQTIILKNGLFFIGKIKDLSSYLKELNKKYYTIKELIEANLH